MHGGHLASLGGWNAGAAPYFVIYREGPDSVGASNQRKRFEKLGWEVWVAENAGSGDEVLGVQELVSAVARAVGNGQVVCASRHPRLPSSTVPEAEKEKSISLLYFGSEIGSRPWFHAIGCGAGCDACNSDD